jgi:hypothetical protein
MTKSWLIAFFVAGVSSGQAFADCVPSPDTPASVIEYFQKIQQAAAGTVLRQGKRPPRL